jgi:hypothetical protein
MTKELFALLMAGTFMIPQTTPAHGGDTTAGLDAPRSNALQTGQGEFLPLPPVPYLDSMPWLNSGSASKGLKVDTLFGPKLDTFGPFLLKPAFPRAQVSAGSAQSGIVTLNSEALAGETHNQTTGHGDYNTRVRIDYEVGLW